MSEKRLTMASLFDGSGGFPLAAAISGIEPIWASEIEPFPIRVTTRRFPNMKHYGDVSKIGGAKVPPVDIITFGSPCQDLSVAGKRAGLEDGLRSNLFYQAVRIIKEMRKETHGQYPRWAIWENVPGAFSSNDGEDFKSVLETMINVKNEQQPISISRPNKWEDAGSILGRDYSLAWRVLDAQYWGVAQRRRRIFLIADFAGGSAGKILFESDGVSGYSSQGFRAWQGPAGVAEEGACPAGVGFDGYNGSVTDDKAATLGVNCGMSSGRNGVLAVENHPADNRVTLSEDGKVQTLTSRMGTGGGNVPLVLKIRAGCEGGGKRPLIQTDKSATLACNNDQTVFVPTVFGICSKDSNAMKSDNPKSGFYEAETSRTIDCNGGNPSCNQGGMAVVALEGNGTRPSHQGSGFSEDGVGFTLNATEHHAVAYGIDRAAFNHGRNAQYGFAVEEEVEPTMVAKGPGAVAHPAYSSSKASFFTEVSVEKANTLVATDYKDPPTVTDKAAYGFYPQMKAECVTFSKEKSGCLVNGTNPGYQNGVVDYDYIVRRLTPTECARLQGFPDWWCSGLNTKHPTEEDIAFWTDVWKTWTEINGTPQKTRNSIISWLKHPYSDASEYKMWGNGVALPCVYFLMEGIVWANTLPIEEIKPVEKAGQLSIFDF